MLVRRAPLFAAVSVLAVALEAAIVYAWHVPFLQAQTFASLTVGGLLDAAIIAITRADFDGAPMIAAFWRWLERSWAVVIVGFVYFFIGVSGYSLLLAGTLPDRIFSVVLLLFAACLVFCETVAVTIEDERWWMLVPQALGISTRVSLTGSMLWRSILLFVVIQIVPGLGISALSDVLNKAHVAHADLWATVPLEVLWTVPFYVLTVLMFFDAIGYEPNRSCDE